MVTLIVQVWGLFPRRARKWVCAWSLGLPSTEGVSGGPSAVTAPVGVHRGVPEPRAELWRRGFS